MIHITVYGWRRCYRCRTETTLLRQVTVTLWGGAKLTANECLLGCTTTRPEGER